MADAPHLPTTFDGWVQFFRAGFQLTAPVQATALQRRLRGNRAVFVGTLIFMLLAAAGLVGLVVADLGRTATYVLVGLLVVVLAFLARYIHRLRGRLQVAAIDRDYIHVSREGIVVAGLLRLPWDRTVGVVALDVRSQRIRPAQRLGAALARSAGATQADLLIGLAKNTGKQVKAAADPRLRILIDAFGDSGSLRLPLDAVLRSDVVEAFLLAVPAAAHVAGRETVVGSDPAALRKAVTKVMSSMPPASEWDIWADLATAAEPRRDDAADDASPPR